MTERSFSMHLALRSLTAELHVRSLAADFLLSMLGMRDVPRAEYLTLSAFWPYRRPVYPVGVLALSRSDAETSRSAR